MLSSNEEYKPLLKSSVILVLYQWKSVKKFSLEILLTLHFRNMQHALTLHGDVHICHFSRILCLRFAARDIAPAHQQSWSSKRRLSHWQHSRWLESEFPLCKAVTIGDGHVSWELFHSERAVPSSRPHTTTKQEPHKNSNKVYFKRTSYLQSVRNNVINICVLNATGRPAYKHRFVFMMLKHDVIASGSLWSIIHLLRFICTACS